MAASEDAVSKVLCASRALLRMDSAVAEPAMDRLRSTSLASDLTWVAESAEAVVSMLCAARAPVTTESAVAEPAADSVRSISDDSD